MRLVPVLLILCSLAACGSPPTRPEPELWENASSADARLDDVWISYTAYLNAYPDGPHAAEVRELYAAFRWREATTSNTRHAYEQFLEDPAGAGRYEAEARYRLAVLDLPDRARVASCILGSYDCPESMWNFLRDYPESDHAREISAWVGQLRVEKDHRSYRAALAAGNYSSLLAYTRAYPEGLHLEEAKAELARYAWETLQAPWILTWAQLGRNFPVSDDGMTARYVEARRRDGLVLTGCMKGDRPIRLDSMQIADDGARPTANSPRVAAIRGTLSATDTGGIAMLVLEPDQCVFTLTTEEFYGVGSRFRLHETKDATGNIRLLSFNGYDARKGEVTILPEGLRFEPGSVVMRRQSRRPLE